MVWGLDRPEPRNYRVHRPVRSFPFCHTDPYLHIASPPSSNIEIELKSRFRRAFPGQAWSQSQTFSLDDLLASVARGRTIISVDISGSNPRQFQTALVPDLQYDPLPLLQTVDPVSGRRTVTRRFRTK